MRLSRLFLVLLVLPVLISCDAPPATPGIIEPAPTPAPIVEPTPTASVEVFVQSQQPVGPCLVLLQRMPTADPVPIPHDGELYVDFEWCASGSSGHVNATAQLSATGNPAVTFYQSLGDYGNGCHWSRVYWAPSSARHDKLYVSASDGLSNARASCGIR